MTVITVTDEKVAELLANGDRFEVRDQSGRLITVARVELAPDPPPPTEWPAEWTAEELDRRVREGKWYTTAEVLEHLRGLSK